MEIIHLMFFVVKLIIYLKMPVQYYNTTILQYNTYYKPDEEEKFCVTFVVHYINAHPVSRKTAFRHLKTVFMNEEWKICFLK